MFINIHISSKNYKSIKLFSSFFTNKILTEKLKLTTTSLFFQNPVKKKIFTVLKSPHVNKKSREQLTTAVYRNVYTFKNASVNNKAFLKAIHMLNELYVNVSITVKLKHTK